MEETTKQKILKEALHLFAEKGFEAVSVAQIAKAVGIKSPSLYKHYTSKQDIFEAIISEMNIHYKEYTATMQFNGSEASQDKQLFANIDEEQLISMGKNLFLFFLHDEYICEFRRLLKVEQFHNRTLRDFYIQQYTTDPLEYQEIIFGYLCQTGLFKQADNDIIALQFYAPIRLMLDLCDCHPDKETEALDMIERHIHQFNQLYRLEKR